MNLELSRQRITQLMAIFVTEIKCEASMGRTDLNKASETILIPLLNEIYGWNLENLNYAENDNNKPGIDLADKAAKICIQVTATTTSDKVKHTLEQFIKHKQFLEYDRLIIFFLKEKNQSYPVKTIQKIIQERFEFEIGRDILDYRNLLKEIASFQIERVTKIREILEANFGSEDLSRKETFFQKPEKIFFTQSHLPKLPPHFLPRPEALDELKEVLFSHSTPLKKDTHSACKIGIYGMGGIGKSVLTNYLARDSEVHSLFSDGIFWFSLGQEPNLTLRQSDFAKMLGDSYPAFQDIQQGKLYLSRLLANKKCLLILDDVWKVHQVSAFNILDKQSKIIFTTRDYGIIQALDAIEFQVKLLSDDEALDLLAISSGNIKENLPPESYEVAKECANLPLALSMIGAIAKARPNRWDNLLQKLRNADLDKLKYQFPDYPYPDLFKAIQVSLEVLEPDTRLRYLDFAVFPENVEIPETTLMIFWRPEGLDKYDIQDITDLLVERSLARRSETGHLVLHDLQYDYVRKQFSNLSTLHARFLDAYSSCCANGWHTCSQKDNYFFGNLAYHLKLSNRKAELHNLLLTSKDWMQAKFIASSSDASYLFDLDFAIEDFHDPLTSKEILTLTQLYAARQAINHRAQNYSDEELEALALLGYVDEAINHARLRALPFRRFHGLLAVINALDKGNTILSSLLEEAYEIAKTLEELKSRYFCELAIALYKAGEETKAQSVIAEAENFAYLARYSSGRNEALAEVVSALSKMLFLEQATALVHDIQDGWAKSEAMGDLAASLLLSGFGEEANIVLEGAVSVAQEIADLEDFYEPIISVCSKWAKALASLGFIEEAFTWIEDIGDTSKTKVLCDLAETLAQLGLDPESNEIFDKVRDIANQTEIYDIKLSILRDLAVSLARCNHESEARYLMTEINSIATSNESSKLAITLSRIAASLVENDYLAEADLFFNKSMQIIQSVTQEHKKMWGLGRIAISLTRANYKELANQVFSEIRKISEAGEHKWDLVKVFAQCGFVEDAKSLIEAVEDDDFRNRLLTELIEELAKIKDFDNAKSLIDLVGDCHHKAMAFIKLTNEMIDDEPIEEMYLFLSTIRDCIIPGIEKPIDKSMALVELAKTMMKLDFCEGEMDDVFFEVRSAIDQIEDESDKEYLFEEYVDGHTELKLGLDISPFSWQNEVKQNKKVTQEALELAFSQKFSEALSTFSRRPALTHSSAIEDFLEELGSWIPAFDKAKPQLSLAILRECIRISSWTSAGWKDIYCSVQASKLWPT
ncbi:NB-ARC domain-containing protein [Phormidium tenue]|uniref:NB-ARC domain-containing protein n=1 Tax=Phormidium tenue NIES-30 TaxID=549789 RepID=A0A1U7J501_9CYAN|nr:NB-ARC domain-containing protein [Phormidium tenue]MBD2232596.1 SMEK domain-containing protein [Phormidium tenue FACHB-1052]OKH47731.1 hypothetical protein NIES30_12145 [Phormidium tenue NIES-30]